MPTVKVTYIGGVDQVDVLCPSGATYRVRRGDSIDVLPADAATLNPVDWTGKSTGDAFAAPADDVLSATPFLPATTEE